MRQYVGFFISLLLALSTLVASVATAAPVTNTGQLADRYIVVLKDGANPRSVAAVLGLKPIHVYESALNGFAAELSAGQLTALHHNPNVAYIEQDEGVTVNTTQTLPPGGLWGLDRIDQQSLPLSGTYSYTATGAGVQAYIISSGIYATHPAFSGRAANMYDTLGGTGTDCNGLGTHIAGVVGATTYGVAKQVNLRGVRFLDCMLYGSVSNLIKSVDWVRANAVRPAVIIITIHWTATTSAALNTAILNLINSGFLVVVPAGDNNADACYNSLASISGIYAVSATNTSDARPAFANYGSCVDMFAPGDTITSTWINNGTKSYRSTFVAAAHVVGCAAKYQSTSGDVPYTTIASWLDTTATPGTGTVTRLLYCPI
jgi:subtilisin family serine protease